MPKRHRDELGIGDAGVRSRMTPSHRKVRDEAVHWRPPIALLVGLFWGVGHISGSHRSPLQVAGTEAGLRI
jgi:hypothetical protein